MKNIFISACVVGLVVFSLYLDFRKEPVAYGTELLKNFSHDSDFLMKKK